MNPRIINLKLKLIVFLIFQQLINEVPIKLIKTNDDEKWSQTINYIFKNKKKNQYLKNNAYKTAKRYTWEKRCKKIITFSEKKYH